VEQRLQIRSEQHTMARFLLDNEWTTSQLNMGQGKTRVILPMLVLELARPGSDQIVRLNFLSQLLSEAYDFLHRSLTASLAFRRLVQLPFHRDVRLSALDVRRVLVFLERCRAAGGSVVVAPEQRLSLQLKWHAARLAGNDALVAELTRLDGQLHFHDILDECDALLSHRFQLIYAIGSATLLPSGSIRWVAAQAVLRAVSRHDGRVCELLSRDNVSRRLSLLAERGAGSFDDIRLLPGDELERHTPDLLRAQADDVIDHSPYQLRWLNEHRQGPARAAIVRFVTDPSMSLDQFRLETVGLRSDLGGKLQEETLLALRSLLACSLVSHCLCRRHRVDYGVDARRGHKTRVAVPFRGSDTPSERSEYAQPDTLIVYTLLAYYHSGISVAQVKEALAALLSLGPAAQQAEYSLWLDSAAPTLSAEQRAPLEHVNKLNPSNDAQLKLLHATYRHNCTAVDFFLNACVLPRETMQFERRLVANSFNLTATSHTANTIGFSGTKDCHLLLPSRVSQRTPDDGPIAGTDGKMIELILRDEGVAVLDARAGDLRSAALDLCVAEGAVALVDAGAAMAGWSNSEVADEVMKRLQAADSRLKGVVFFDQKENTWYVRSRLCESWPLGSSPLHERDCFVIYNESHCRGADMKLRTDALAVLTLGPDMSKDTLMQAAGRLRKLDQEQRLLFAVPPKLEPKIRGALPVSSSARAQLTSRDLLHWVIRNTGKAIGEGLVEWGKQGSNFCSTSADPRARPLDKQLELEDLYGRAVQRDTACAVVSATLARDLQRCKALGVDLAGKDDVAEAAIKERARKYGLDVFLCVTGLDEECERELEVQRELEREMEMQIPRRAPAAPTPWRFDAVFSMDPSAAPTTWRFDAVFDPTAPGFHHLSKLDVAAGAMRLSDAFAMHYLPQLRALKWGLSDVWVTRNFVETVVGSDGARLNDLTEYMRPVDAVVVFGKSGCCLLVSEWEADRLLGLAWA